MVTRLFEDHSYIDSLLNALERAIKMTCGTRPAMGPTLENQTK